MLIDWLELRRQISDLEEQELYKLLPWLALMEIKDVTTDEVLNVKLVVNSQKVRSDFEGMVWRISSNGKQKYLSVGASPASILGKGNNVFGPLDYQFCKKIILEHARAALTGSLFQLDGWLPRRVDITENFLLEDNNQVKQALNILRVSEGSRQRTTTDAKAGDSVYHGAGSRFRHGKNYDKWHHALHICKKFQKQNKPIPFTPLQLDLLKGVLRQELTLGPQFFDENPDESLLSPEFLTQQHYDFFRQFLGSSEVTSMDALLKQLLLISPSPGIARSAYGTFLSIRQLGFHFVEANTSERTFRRHKKLLIEAGLSLGDLKSAQIIPLRKRAINLQPVTSWEQLEELVNRQRAA